MTHAMTARTDTEDPPPAIHTAPAAWDEQRLAGLVADVGEAGMRHILNLFHADLPFLLRQLEVAIARGEAETARQVLAAVEEGAAGIGLAGLASLARRLSATPLDAASPQTLTRAAALVRVVPPVRGRAHG